MSSVTVQVPATSANLGPGFDTLGVAVKLYNRVTVTFSKHALDNPFLEEAADLYFKASEKKPIDVGVRIYGDVPRSRGLGSSVTVRLGFLMALNRLLESPLSKGDVLKLACELEGHPDNAAPAFYGGFCACSPDKVVRVPVSPKLRFIAAIPKEKLKTEEARAVLPETVTRAEAARNLQFATVITGAFCTQRYQRLKGAFQDCLHQPHRAKLIPGFNETVAAAEKAGALGAYLSGAGSTIMALSLDDAHKIGKAMKNALEEQGHEDVDVKVLRADNSGARFRK